MELLNKLTSAKETVQLYWDQPPKGKYMSFREIAAFSGAGSVFTVLLPL